MSLNKSLILLLCLCWAFASCRNSEDAEPAKCKLSRLTYSHGESLAFEYLRGRISKIRSAEWYETFEYDGNGKLNRINTHNANGELYRYCTLTYENPRLIKSIIHAKQGDGFFSAFEECLYHYDANGNLIKKEIVGESYQRYEYNEQGNVSKVFAGDNSAERLLFEYLEYDANPQILSDFPMLRFSPNIGEEWGRYLSKNNYKKRYSPKYGQEETAQYQYSPQGYPTKISQTMDLGTDVLEYNCQ